MRKLMFKVLKYMLSFTYINKWWIQDSNSACVPNQYCPWS